MYPFARITIVSHVPLNGPARTHRPLGTDALETDPGATSTLQKGPQDGKPTGHKETQPGEASVKKEKWGAWGGSFKKEGATGNISCCPLC